MSENGPRWRLSEQAYSTADGELTFLCWLGDADVYEDSERYILLVFKKAVRVPDHWTYGVRSGKRRWVWAIFDDGGVRDIFVRENVNMDALQALMEMRGSAE